MRPQNSEELLTFMAQKVGMYALLVTTADATDAIFLSPIVSAFKSQFLGSHRIFLPPKSLLKIIYVKQRHICYIYLKKG